MNDIEDNLKQIFVETINSEKPITYGIGCNCYSTRITQVNFWFLNGNIINQGSTRSNFIEGNLIHGIGVTGYRKAENQIRNIEAT